MDTEDEEMDDSPISPPLPAARVADINLSILRQYFESRDLAIGGNCLTVVASLEKTIAKDLKHAHRQTKITDFMTSC